MNPEIKRRWVEALRSGDYQQGMRWLNRTVDGVRQHCCLGVLCDLAVQDGVVTTALAASKGFVYPQAADSVAYGPDAASEDTTDWYPSILPVAVCEWAGIDLEFGGNPMVELPSGESKTLASLNDSGSYDFDAIAVLIDKEL